MSRIVKAWKSLDEPSMSNDSLQYVAYSITWSSVTKESLSVVWVVEVSFEVSFLFLRMDVGFEDIDTEVAYAGLFFVTIKEAVDLF